MGREVLADGHKPTQLPALLISRWWFNSRMPPAREVLAHRHHPGAIPGSRTNLLTGCASARCRVSKTQLTPGGTEAACHFHLGSWQTRNALALQASLCGSVAHRLHQFQLRETRPMNREKPHKLLQVGVTPTPAPIYIREVIRLPDCKSGVRK